MSKQDLTEYSDGELSLLFQNDEGLYYTFNRATWDTVEAMARACFTFTDEQLSELKEDYDEEHGE